EPLASARPQQYSRVSSPITHDPLPPANTRTGVTSGGSATWVGDTLSRHIPAWQKSLWPKHTTAPSRIPHVWPTPAATELHVPGTMNGVPADGGGVRSWPNVLSPQHASWPVSSTKHACLTPAARWPSAIGGSPRSGNSGFDRQPAASTTANRITASPTSR